MRLFFLGTQSLNASFYRSIKIFTFVRKEILKFYNNYEITSEENIRKDRFKKSPPPAGGAGLVLGDGNNPVRCFVSGEEHSGKACGRSTDLSAEERGRALFLGYRRGTGGAKAGARLVLGIESRSWPDFQMVNSNH